MAASAIYLVFALSSPILVRNIWKWKVDALVRYLRQAFILIRSYFGACSKRHASLAANSA